MHSVVNTTTGVIHCAVGSQGSDEFFYRLRVSGKAREDWIGVGTYRANEWNGILEIRGRISQYVSLC